MPTKHTIPIVETEMLTVPITVTQQAVASHTRIPPGLVRVDPITLSKHLVALVADPSMIQRQTAQLVVDQHLPDASHLSVDLVVTRARIDRPLHENTVMWWIGSTTLRETIRPPPPMN